MHAGKLLLAITLASVASAQATDDQLAKQHYQTGQLHYERGEFDQALAGFREAYGLAPRPDLQYNIAQVCEKLLRLEEAVAAYRAYLEGKPDATDRKFVDSRIEFLDRQIAEKKAAAAPPPPPTEEVKKEGAPRPGGAWRRTAGWVTIGVGGALAAMGVVFGVIAKNKSGELEDANAAGDEWADAQSIRSSGVRAEKLQIVGLAAGGVGIAAGVVLVLTAPRAGATASAAPGGFEVRW